MPLRSLGVNQKIFRMWQSVVKTRSFSCWETQEHIMNYFLNKTIDLINNENNRDRPNRRNLSYLYKTLVILIKRLPGSIETTRQRLGLDSEAVLEVNPLLESSKKIKVKNQLAILKTRFAAETIDPFSPFVELKDVREVDTIIEMIEDIRSLGIELSPEESADLVRIIKNVFNGYAFSNEQPYIAGDKNGRNYLKRSSKRCNGRRNAC